MKKQLPYLGGVLISICTLSPICSPNFSFPGGFGKKLNNQTWM
jgi:hypothetical protein